MKKRIYNYFAKVIMEFLSKIQQYFTIYELMWGSRDLTLDNKKKMAFNFLEMQH